MHAQSECRLHALAGEYYIRIIAFDMSHDEFVDRHLWVTFDEMLG